MTNREKKAEQILDIACTGCALAMTKEGVLVKCDEIECWECAFYNDKPCEENIAAWANSEYEEPKIIGIDENTPVDTKILVSDDGEEWHRRHFAGIKDNKIHAWDSGMTSFSIKDTDDYGDYRVPWEYAKIY